MIVHQVAVGVTAIELVSAQRGRISVTLRNVGANDVYISYQGGVTTSNGFPVKAGETLQLRKIDGDDTESALYAVGSGATTLAVIR